MVNKLTFISFHHKDKHHQKWNLYQCSCGNQVVLREYSVKNGNTKSCGCHRKEKPIETTEQRMGSVRLNHLLGKTNKNNTSGVTGVCYNTKTKRWLAHLMFNKKRYATWCKTKDEAIEARKALEEQAGIYFGVMNNE